MSGDLNTVALVGNLTEDPELNYTTQGTAVTNFTVAVNRYFQDSAGQNKEKTSFIPVKVWGNQAENVDDFLSKGSGVAVSGRLQQQRWENDEGETRSKMVVVADNVRFLNGSDSSGTQETASAATTDEDDSDIPF